MSGVQVYDGEGENTLKWVPPHQRISVRWKCEEIRESPGEDGNGCLVLVDPDDQTQRQLNEISEHRSEGNEVVFERLRITDEYKISYDSGGKLICLQDFQSCFEPESDDLGLDHDEECECTHCHKMTMSYELYLRRR